MTSRYLPENHSGDPAAPERSPASGGRRVRRSPVRLRGPAYDDRVAPTPEEFAP
ncbi:hypothetical protein [Brachybacterium sacelli]|uniref:hypothetical protein n=1 Tax=Brachybacterium sacelli TaxID=173364 RepID=UPI003615F6B7